MKGKYAARAANREAARDNEIIVQKMAEIDRLTRELADARRALADERRDREAIILTRADELSRKAIDQARQETAEETAAHRETRHWVAGWLTNYLDKLAELNPEINVFVEDEEINLHHFLTALVGAGHVGDYTQRWLAEALGEHITTRRFRRVANKVMDERRGDSRIGQVTKDALVAKLKMDQGLTPAVRERVALEELAFSSSEKIAQLIHKPWGKDDDEQETQA
jgi:hypothetical protein